MLGQRRRRWPSIKRLTEISATSRVYWEVINMLTQRLRRWVNNEPMHYINYNKNSIPHPTEHHTSLQRLYKTCPHKHV